MLGKDGNMTRRRFISTSAGLISAGFVSFNVSCSQSEKEAPARVAPEKDLICRRLGRTGYEVPIIGMGIMNADNPELVHAACEAGIRYFNASGEYQFGRVEENLGRAVNRLKIRDKVVIATGDYDFSQLREVSPAEVTRKMIQSCERSLRRLGTDYIDILYIYQADDSGDINNEAAIEAMTTLKNQGKIRYAGVTTHTGMTNVISAVVQGGFYDMVLTSINFTMADDAKLLQAISDAAKKDIGIVAMKVMAGGTRWPNPGSRKNYSSTTIAKACLKWVMRNENITTCIPGFVNFEHMRQDFSVAYDLEYSEEEQNFISDNGVRLGMGFCRQCRECLATCPNSVDVPTLMRTHMYAAQYGDFHKARATLNRIPGTFGLRTCDNCTHCQATCANTVDIAGRINELRVIYS